MSSDSNSESASQYQDSSGSELEVERPNRWKGAPSTWQHLTAQEHGLASALDQQRNEDLAVHLYNAFALRQRARILMEDPDSTIKHEFPGVPVEEQIFRPPKYWTAWPLPADEVPRLDDGREEDGRGTYRRHEIARPSRDLEDVLLGVAVRFAKERFEGREEIGRAEERKEERNAVEEEDEIMSYDGMEHVVEERSEVSPVPVLKPVVSVDDERSRVLLRPSIRHTLSKLDEVLMALHHARKTCRRYSLSEANTDDENSSLAGEPLSAKEPRGRPRKFANLPDRTVIASSVEEKPENLFRAKKSHLGRPQKVYPRLEGETQQDYLVRIARMQKKPLPSFAPPLPVKDEPDISPERKRKLVGKRATTAELETRDKRKIGLRDWSEVLGSAALVGFPEDVIARATQRCANLFGESMIMRTLVEAPFGDDDAHFEKKYHPEVIPVLDDENSESEDSDVLSEESNPRARRYTGKRQFGIASNNVFCPIPHCSKRRRGFRHNMALKKHLQNSHDVLAEQLDEYILPSDDEMAGAVHVDGFLKPVKDFRKQKRNLKAVVKVDSRGEDDSEDSEGSEDEDDEDDSSDSEEHSASSEHGPQDLLTGSTVEHSVVQDGDGKDSDS
jgi:hypothetical protein